MNSPKQEADHAPTINERMTALGIPGRPPNTIMGKFQVMSFVDAE